MLMSNHVRRLAPTGHTYVVMIAVTKVGRQTNRTRGRKVRRLYFTSYCRKAQHTRPSPRSHRCHKWNEYFHRLADTSRPTGKRAFTPGTESDCGASPLICTTYYIVLKVVMSSSVCVGLSVYTFTAPVHNICVAPLEELGGFIHTARHSK